MPGQKDKPEKPLLEIFKGDLPASVIALRDRLANSGILFDRGRILVHLVTDANGVLYAREVKSSGVILAAQEVCQPVGYDKKGERVPVTLPLNVAQMYLELGEWKLKPLAGISTAPLLREDGSLLTTRGYDSESQIFCDCRITVHVPESPTKEQAKAALRTLRDAFKTFSFADAAMKPMGKLRVVDIGRDAGLSESSYIAAVLTAVCRAVLWLAPALLVSAPKLSGSGSGKGLLVRAAAMTAYGIRLAAFTVGHSMDEFDKRLATALLGGDQGVFIDNANDLLLRSSTLASATTERPARVRILGHSVMLPLNCTAWLAITGNALKVSQDLARRFLGVLIDPAMENPEDREFNDNFLAGMKRRRPELLSAALTILRYGRVNVGRLPRGKPLGSFEQWGEWVRDPLLALGCKDPAEGTKLAKATDPERQEIAQLFELWRICHGEEAVTVKDLDEEIQILLNPHKKARQFVTRALQRMAGTRHAGYVLRETTELADRARWTPPTFALQATHRAGEEQADEEQEGQAAHQAEAEQADEEQSETPETPESFHSQAGNSADSGPETPETPETPMHFTRARDEGDERDERGKNSGAGKPSDSGVSGVSPRAPSSESRHRGERLRAAVMATARRSAKSRAQAKHEREAGAADGEDGDGW
jgi:hypothetical protein